MRSIERAAAPESAGEPAGSRGPGHQEPVPLVKPVPADRFLRHEPTVAEMRWDRVAAAYLTPNERFFVRSQGPTPRISAAAWRLDVTGPSITRPVRLTYDDLRRLPSVTVTCALECAGNGRGFLGERDGRVAPGAPWALGGIGVAEWTGVRLSEILKLAGVRSRALEVMPIGLDDRAVRRPLPLAKAMEDDTILAYGMNGAALPADHGYPARVVVPGWAGIASIKWVGRIEVSDKPLSSPWNTEQYVLREPGKSGPAPPVAEQVVKSALELPWPATLEVGPNTLRGRSWSGTGAIARVEWSVDGGPWRPARLVPPNLPRAWVRWTLRWDAARGNHEIRVRAMDDQMHVQPESSLWNELGYLNGAILAHPVLVA